MLQNGTYQVKLITENQQHHYSQSPESPELRMLKRKSEHDTTAADSKMGGKSEYDHTESRKGISKNGTSSQIGITVAASHRQQAEKMASKFAINKDFA